MAAFNESISRTGNVFGSFFLFRLILVGCGPSLV